jgi:nucleotidyltransferase substrate binding protein (TIGR01987 family)
MMSVDIRWKQRYQNFEKAMKYLENAVNKIELSDLEKAGIIHIYLVWKTVKDFLEEKAVLAKFPKDTIKEAFKYEIIENGDMWMDMLEKRNLMAHTYDQNLVDLAYRLIVNDYYPALKQVYLKLGSEL